MSLGLPAGSPAGADPVNVPNYQHIVVVIEENYGYSDIVGNGQAPYINSLIMKSALLTNYHAIAHPSEPNYLELFTGSTQGDNGDNCPLSYSAPNLASQLSDAGKSFVGYAEGLPSPGYTGCSASASYDQNHVPWASFTKITASESQPFSAFPSDFSQLPNVAFVIPNRIDDMHDSTGAIPPITAGDSWLQTYLSGYVTWATTHDSLFVLAFDESPSNANQNQVLTLLSGQGVVAGQDSTYYSHDSLLRTIEDSEGLPALGNAVAASDIAVFGAATPPTTTTVPSAPVATPTASVSQTALPEPLAPTTSTAPTADTIGAAAVMMTIPQTAGRLTARSSSLPVRLRCLNGPCNVQLQLSGSARVRERTGAASTHRAQMSSVAFSMASGATRLLRIPLNRLGRQLLQSAGTGGVVNFRLSGSVSGTEVLRTFRERVR